MILPVNLLHPAAGCCLRFFFIIYRAGVEKSSSEKGNQALITFTQAVIIPWQFNQKGMWCNQLKSKKKNLKIWLFTIVAMIIIVPLAWLLFIRMEGEMPSVGPLPKGPAIGISQTIHIHVSDTKSGVKRVQLSCLQDQKETVLFERDFSSAGFLKGGTDHTVDVDVLFEPAKLGIKDGKAILRLVTGDFSWRKWGNGNKIDIQKQIIIDSVAPEADVLSRSHNVAQGGSALAVYRLSEPCLESGVQVGENFFPGHAGYFSDPDIFLAFFALDHTQGRDTRIFIRAVDVAGNSTRTDFPHYIKGRTFKKDTLKISDRFLSMKMPEFELTDSGATGLDPIEKFLKINRDLREANFKKILSISQKTENKLFWKGTFSRLPGSARRAGFADHREYLYKGQVIDHQIHMGIDLASVKRADVPASNSGRVVFCSTLGIYGRTVILDHGFGLFSLYAHLSRIDVEKGQMVAKGNIIGKTGRTGMAAGDHLHFGVMVHNTFVNPVEWWHGTWIKNNVMTKINDITEGLK